MLLWSYDPDFLCTSISRLLYFSWHFYWILFHCGINFQNCHLLSVFCLVIFGISCMERPLDMRKKKRRIHIIKTLFILLLKTKTLKTTQLSTVCFCYYFNAILLCALMLWITKHLPWLLYIFFYMFFYFSDTLFSFFSSILVFASVMVFDLFLKCRADWLSIFLSWRCLRSSMKHSGSTPF